MKKATTVTIGIIAAVALITVGALIVQNLNASEFCEVERGYVCAAKKPVTCVCPEGYEWKVVKIGWGPCTASGKGDCPAVTKKRVKKSLKTTFVMIHFEVGAYNWPWFKDIAYGSTVKNLKYQKALWPTAVRLVNLADRYGIKLTLVLNPQWAEYILKDPQKVEIVKEWQDSGHEIAFHHHGFEHLDWNGYSNIKTQEVLRDPRYRGTVEEGFAYVKRLAAPHEVAVGTLTDWQTDLVNDIKIMTIGGGRHGNGVSDAVSEPDVININGKNITIIKHGFLESTYRNNSKTDSVLEKFKKLYLETGDNKIFGIVTHVHDYHRYPKTLQEWFEFLKEQKAKVKTVSEIIEDVQKKTIGYERSPFGIFSPYGEVLVVDKADFTSKNEISRYLRDIGVKWIQELPFIGFSNIPNGIEIYSRVGREAGMSSNTINDPSIVERYKAELREVIRKNKDRVKYWEVDTEPSGIGGWNDNPQGYAKLLKITYKIVKEECADCKIIFGGLPGIELNDIYSKSAKFLKRVLEAGAVGYFDGLEFKQHHVSAKDYLLLKNKIHTVDKILAQYGINIQKIPIFIEAAMYDGNPNDPVPKLLERDLPVQTEKEQAESLIKLYVYGTSLGIDKVFWNLIYERGDYEPGHIKPFAQNPFNHYGLINNPTNNDNKDWKKLAYYTYKLMVEKLEGSNWNNVKAIQEENGIHIYKFVKKDTGKPVWVAWNDNGAPQTITISGIGSNKAKITGAVPKYNSGRDVKDYETAFNEETKEVKDGKATIILGETPVFVEEE